MVIFADKMMFFRLSHEVNSKHMFEMVRVKYVEMQISLSETQQLPSIQVLSERFAFGLF